MRQSFYKIGAVQKEIRKLGGDHFVNISLKVAKSSVEGNLVDGVLEAGTILTSSGYISTGSDVFGIVYQNVDFNNSTGTELVSVMIHGFVDTKKIIFDKSNASAQKAALSMISLL